MSKVFIICAPSGAGKTTIANKAVEVDKNMALSISHTTRPPRPGEVDGKDYYFVTEKNFQKLFKENQFIESANVYGFSYGTTKSWVDKMLGENLDILLEIDCQGAQQIKNNIKNAVGIFILPPSRDELKKRLTSRKQDSQEVIERRLKSIDNEIANINQFDYVIINTDVEKAVKDFISIVKAERLTTSSQTDNINKALG